jgi:hypothetical protein
MVPVLFSTAYGTTYAESGEIQSGLPLLQGVPAAPIFFAGWAAETGPARQVALKKDV